MTVRMSGLATLAILSLPVLASAALNVSVTTNKPSPQPLDTSITLTAAAIGDPDPSPVYEYAFSIAPPGKPAQVRRGFGHAASWTWTPSAYEGTFTIIGTVKNVHAGTSGTASIPFTLTTRLVNGLSSVSQTANPLVAFFSGPPCLAPNLMRVRSTPTSVPTGGISASTATATLPCRADSASSAPDLTSMNFFVGGLYPNTMHNLHYEVITPSGSPVRTGADFQFFAGSIPTNINIPARTPVGVPSGVNPIILHNPITIPVNGKVFSPFAADVAGNVLWYSANVPPARTEVGGSYWGFVPGADDYVQGIREVDLAGNAIAETTVGAVNEQLVAMGKPRITSMHHEVRRIIGPTAAPPTGYILTFGSHDKSSTTAQGGTPSHPVDIIGDMILVLDSNFNVVWTWDTFDHLDVNQTAILNEQCTQPAGGGCPPFNTAFAVGNDWTHANSAQYTPYDGNIIISIRHQDVVIKVAYGDGAGDGHVVWKLGHGPIEGPGGAPLPTVARFTNSTIGSYDLAHPYFSHQHDAEIELNGAVIGGARILTLFDNGNTRAASDPTARSRCQLYAISESGLVANLNRNTDMGTYSFAIGAAQLLPNGSLVCDSGFIGGFPASTTDPKTETIEADNTTGSVFYRLQVAEDSYRTFRMANMYTPPTP